MLMIKTLNRLNKFKKNYIVIYLENLKINWKNIVDMTELALIINIIKSMLNHN